ncbi:MAG: alkylation response protein AidB-like acyl-CoA dehydrogenase [Paracoccaceae bacterium]|jgi:alkylation response protein AidB-like acyl-CoA dehydrogenase
MELLLNDEQSMLRDSAATFTERRGGAERLRKQRDSDKKIDRDIWAQAAEAGWLAILAPESAGGLELGLTELCLVSEELGKGLVPEPIAAVAAVARALGASDISEALVSGEKIILPALMETTRSIGDEAPAVTASATGDGVSLDGVKTGIPCPDDADGFLVSAAGTDGPILAIVNRDDAEIQAEPTLDGATVGTITLNGVPGTAVAGPNETPATIAALLDALHLSNAAELLGVMETAQAITIDYLKTREQFDKPIGSFQALQHRAVDSLAAIEMCRSLIYQAARALDGGGAAPGLASAALSKAAASALDVCKSAVQMHGGIGFTDEHDIGLYLKRAVILAARYGNAGLHRKRYAEFAEMHP